MAVRELEHAGDRRPVALDAVSKAIVASLQQDGRRSYTDIARQVGLSEAAVRQRVQRLLDGGVMQIVAVTDPAQLGFTRQAMVGVSVSGDVRRIAERIAALPEVDYLVLTAGTFDLLVEVVCDSDEALIALLDDGIRSLPGVTAVDTSLYLRLHKQKYDWGVR